MSAQSGKRGRWRETSPQFPTRCVLSQFHWSDYLGAWNRLYWDRCTWYLVVHIHGKKISSMSEITINIPVATWCYQSVLWKKMAAVLLPQFLSNLTRPITHKVIFRAGGWGGGAKFVAIMATLPILCLKFIKLFCAFLCAILRFSCAKNCG